MPPHEQAEPVPDGPSTQRLIEIAKQHGVVVSAGLVEVRGDNACYNTYVIVSPDGFIGRYSKCHCIPGTEFSYFKQGNSFPVYDLGKIRVGVLICYDNHFPEAHRIYAIKGAEAILMPHVTVGRGWWHDFPVAEAQRQAKNWILTWLRARAFDNSVFTVFVNQASADSKDPGTLGCSMVLNPDGDVLAECETTGEEITVAELSAQKYYEVRARTHDYVSHRRPELYGDLCRTDIAEEL
jgi:predicted amidohydrolase